MKFSRPVFAAVLFIIYLLPGLQAQTALPRGFESINLDLSLEEVKTRLLKAASFSFRGDPEVTMLREPLTSLLEAEGGHYITRGAFQFTADKLEAITLVMNTRLLDYFSFYTSFTKKYGEPVRLDPSKAEWEDSRTRLVLEKPLTVKYLDLRALNARADRAATEKAMGQLSREMFIDKF